MNAKFGPGSPWWIKHGLISNRTLAELIAKGVPCDIMGVDSKEYHPVMPHKGREAEVSPLPTDVGQN